MFEKLREGLNKFIDKIATTELKAEDLETILWDLKLNLIESDVAVIVADKICDEVKNRLIGLKVKRTEDKKKIIKDALRSILLEILKPQTRIDLLKKAEEKRRLKEPLKILFVGFHGTGKTTTIAKIASLLIKNGYSVVLACSDTHRAGSIEQLSEHARRIGVRMIRHKYGADAAAVAFDAVQYAKSKGINVVLIDTAGRIQTDRNLMEEMRKISHVIDPDLTIFVGDALAGNDALYQAEEFDKFVDVDASILTKVDTDTKGGTSISISYITEKPIIYIGTGQGYDDLEPFNPEAIVKKILR